MADDGWTALEVRDSLTWSSFFMSRELKLEAKDNCGRTSLFLASAKGCIEVVQHLLSRGALVDTTDWYGSTSAFAAVRNGHEVVVASLFDFEGLDVQFEDGFGHILP
jgi:ankyrin repeat protein